MLGSLVCYLPRPKSSVYAKVVPGSCPGMGLGVKMYNRSDLDTFYARKLKFGVLLRS